jgi:preprotein translocase subunit SecF
VTPDIGVSELSYRRVGVSVDMLAAILNVGYSVYSDIIFNQPILI